MESLNRLTKIIESEDVSQEYLVDSETYFSKAKTDSIEKKLYHFKEFLKKFERNLESNFIDVLFVLYEILLNITSKNEDAQSVDPIDIEDFIKLYEGTDKDEEDLNRRIILEELEKRMLFEIGKRYVNEITDAYNEISGRKTGNLLSPDKINEFKSKYINFMICFTDNTEIDYGIDHMMKSDVIRSHLNKEDITVDEILKVIKEINYSWDLRLNGNSTTGILEVLDNIDFIYSQSLRAMEIIQTIKLHISSKVCYEAFISGLYEFSTEFYKAKDIFKGYPIELEMEVPDLIDELLCQVGFEMDVFNLVSGIFNQSKFKELRKRSGFTVEEIASQCKLTDKNTINNLVYGKTKKVRVGNLIDLSLSLKVKPSEFIKQFIEIPFYSRFIFDEIDDKLLNMELQSDSYKVQKKMVQIRELFQDNVIIGINDELLPSSLKEELAEAIEEILIFIEKEDDGFELYVPLMNKLEKIKTKHKTLKSLRK